MESLNYRSRSERVRFVKELKYKYINEFPDGTPFVVACENGRLADVESFVNNHDMKETGMTLKAMVNRVGKSCHGLNYTGLMLAAENEHFHVVQYLLKQCAADPNITDDYGSTSLHFAAHWNEKNIDCIELLLDHMSGSSINQKSGRGETALDIVYQRKDENPIILQIIARIRSKGGIANRYNANGSRKK